jgi:threonine/homoserine/homoserine lactone efflux protein
MRPVSGFPALLADASPLSLDGGKLFIQGAIVGIAVTAPPGPVGGLCIRRTLRDGMWPGLLTALGALLADALYGTLAAFGFSQIAMPHGKWGQILSGVVAGILLLLGGKYLRQAIRGEVAAEPAPDARRGPGWIGLTVGTFFLTLWTPGTLPAFLVMFASLGLAQQSADCEGGPYLVVAGVMSGAAAWWIALCAVVFRFRDHVKGWLRGMEFALAFLMFGGAAYAIWLGMIHRT